MTLIKIEIVRFVDAHQPGFVAVELIDADGVRHEILDKVPIFTDESLDATSAYPRPAVIRCEVLQRDGDRARIRLLDGVETTLGETELVVAASQLS